MATLINNVDLPKAYKKFFQTLEDYESDSLSSLKEVYGDQHGKLSSRMDVLEDLADAGMQEDLADLLSDFLVEWAIKEAIGLLLRYPTTSFDPTDKTLQQEFWQQLCGEHQLLSSELLLRMKNAKDAQAQKEVERSQSWQAVAYRSIEDQRNQNKQFHEASTQWVQGQQQMNQQWFNYQYEMFNRQQQSNQQWANVAMLGAQQAQLGLKQWYDFAAQTQQNVAGMLNGTEQRQGMLVEQAVKRANTQKWVTRLTIIGLVMVGIVAAFGCAYVALIHLY